MKTIAFIAQKGGCGKTTLSGLLAWRLEELGIRVAFQSWDPQAGAGHDEVAPTASTQVLVVDTPGYLTGRFGSSSKGTQDVVHQADLIYVPCLTSGYDVESLPATIKTIRSYARPGVPIKLIVNRIDARLTTVNRSLLPTLAKNFDVIALIPQSGAITKTSFSHTAVSKVEPYGQAAVRIDILARDTCRLLGLQPAPDNEYDERLKAVQQRIRDAQAGRVA